MDLSLCHSDCTNLGRLTSLLQRGERRALPLPRAGGGPLGVPKAHASLQESDAATKAR